MPPCIRRAEYWKDESGKRIGHRVEQLSLGQSEEWTKEVPCAPGLRVGGAFNWWIWHLAARSFD